MKSPIVKIGAGIGGIPGGFVAGVGNDIGASVTDVLSQFRNADSWKFHRSPPYENDPVTTFNSPVDRTSGARLYRGYIREFFPSDSTAGGDGNGSANDPLRTYQFNFLYNPNTLVVNYSIDSQNIYAGPYQDPLTMQGVTAPNLPGATIALDLMVERMQVPHITKTNNHPEGVMHDIRILDKILTRGMGGPNNYMFGQMPYVRLRLSRHGGGVMPPLGYLGYINATTVTYTRFNVDMVPTRAQIGINITAVVENPEITDTSHIYNEGRDGAGGNIGYTISYVGSVGTALNPVALHGSNGQYPVDVYKPGRGSRGPALPGISLNGAAPTTTDTGNGNNGGSGTPNTRSPSPHSSGDSHGRKF